MDIGIHVDRDLCIGSGQCVHWAGGVFDQDDQAMAVVVDPRGEPEERIVHAVLACPMRAITLEIEGRRVGAEDLRDWVRGIDASDPIVARFHELSADHHELQEVLRNGATAAGALRDQVIAHLRDEERAYEEITALIGPGLVDAFGDDHSRIEAVLSELAGADADPSRLDDVLQHLVATVEAHIRLEENVLFPAALSAVARRAATPAR